jgi:hypothetical protein
MWQFDNGESVFHIKALLVEANPLGRLCQLRHVKPGHTLRRLSLI